MRARIFWIALIVIVVAGVAAAIAFRGGLPLALRPGQPEDSLQTAEVRTIQAVTTVEASGAVEPRQQAALAWQTTGTVATVEVAVGDFVEAGQVLMTLEPATAANNVIQARAELIDAQNVLDNLLNPSPLSIAQAEQAVADAEAALETAERELRGVSNPNVDYYQDQVADLEQALLTAQQNVEKANIGGLATALQRAADDLELKTNQLSDAQSAQERCPGCTTLFINATGRRMELKDAQAEYDAAVDAYRVAELNYEQSLTNNRAAVDNAADDLADARANLAAALAGPDAEDVAQKQVAVAHAQATLDDAREHLETLLSGPDPDDLATAEVRVQAAQATLDSIVLRAPFAGEVLAVNYLPGDPATPSGEPIILADRRQLHVDVAVDETDVGQISLGDTARLTFDALPNLALTGTVAAVDNFGQTVQGLVRYNVRVDLAETDPRLYLNMTASAVIVTAVEDNALAVPLEAVQYDSEGEYVNRVRTDGTLERVAVTSGVIDGDWVTVRGGLAPGQPVQLAPPQAPGGGPFGPG